MTLTHRSNPKIILQGLGDGTRSFNSDILAGIAEGIESVLTSGGGIEGGKFTGHDGSQDSITSILGGETKLRSTDDPQREDDDGLLPPDITEGEDKRTQHLHD